MSRYFLEVAYKGSVYSGFQVQENANTIQAEIQKALHTICRLEVTLTGSSRTDAGVHAFQNFFHFDFDPELHPHLVYKLNALLPPDIAVRHIYPVAPTAHSRFDAVSREYEYTVYSRKEPFMRDRGYYFPYAVDEGLLQETAAYIQKQIDFFAFAKTKTGVINFRCAIDKSEWRREGGVLIYMIRANRFLRGMVRSLTGTQLQVARGVIDFTRFKGLFETEGAKCRYSLPPTGLILRSVEYPERILVKKP